MAAHASTDRGSRCSPRPLSVALGAEAGGRPMNRRNFLALLGGASILSTPVATAQPTEHTRRVGALVLDADNAEGQSLVAAFRGRLEQLGWMVGRNIQIDVRWAGDDGRMTRSYAAEIVRAAPDVIL